MFVLVSLTLFQSTNVNTRLLQTGIKLYLQLYFTSALLLIFMGCSIKVTSQKSRQSHLPGFWKYSLQNLGKSPKSLHTTSEWMNSNCHRLFLLCPLFHFCWKWGVRHSPSFAIPQLSPIRAAECYKYRIIYGLSTATKCPDKKCQFDQHRTPFEKCAFWPTIMTVYQLCTTIDHRHFHTRA